VVRLRLGIMPNVALSCFGLVQYNSASDAVVGNLRLRFNPREGNDLYVVYNHVLDVDRGGVTPVPPLTRTGTLLIKYSHTLAFQGR